MEGHALAPVFGILFMIWSVCFVLYVGCGLMDKWYELSTFGKVVSFIATLGLSYIDRNNHGNLCG